MKQYAEESQIAVPETDENTGSWLIRNLFMQAAEKWGISDRRVRILCQKGRIAGISNIEYRFYKAYEMEIEDKRTVYGECTYRLVPREDEPSVCLMHGWIYLPSA